MGRISQRIKQSVKQKVSNFVEEKKELARRNSALGAIAKQERRDAYEKGYLQAARSQGKAAGRKAAQGGGGGVRGALNQFAVGFEGGTLGNGKGGGGLDIKVPDFDMVSGLGTSKKKKKQDIDDFLL